MIKYYKSSRVSRVFEVTEPLSLFSLSSHPRLRLRSPCDRPSPSVAFSGNLLVISSWLKVHVKLFEIFLTLCFYCILIFKSVRLKKKYFLLPLTLLYLILELLDQVDWFKEWMQKQLYQSNYYFIRHTYIHIQLQTNKKSWDMYIPILFLQVWSWSLWGQGVIVFLVFISLTILVRTPRSVGIIVLSIQESFIFQINSCIRTNLDWSLKNTLLDQHWLQLQYLLTTELNCNSEDRFRGRH